MQLLGRDIVHLREVEVFDLDSVNRALNKPAFQSSTFYDAANAVNGNLSDFSHTENEAGTYQEWVE